MVAISPSDISVPDWLWVEAAVGSERFIVINDDEYNEIDRIQKIYSNQFPDRSIWTKKEFREAVRKIGTNEKSPDDFEKICLFKRILNGKIHERKEKQKE